MSRATDPIRPDPVAVCAHCGLPVGSGSRFCCGGCAAALEVIERMGLGLYYERRLLDPAARAPKPEPAGAAGLARYVREVGDGVGEIALMVDGIQCGACVWLIEAVLARTPGVIEARVNMTTRRLRIRWALASASADQLVEAVAALGYPSAPYDASRSTAAGDRSGRVLLRCVAVAGFAAGNLMLLSIGIWVGFSQGMGEATRSLLHWASAAVALPAVAYAGRPFFGSAMSALRHGRTNMDVPISLGVLLVTGMSLAETIRGGAHTYFDSAAMLLFFLLIGRVLDQRARARARGAAEELLGLRAIDVAVLRADGTVERRPQDSVTEGERVLVGMGERVGVDGLVERGTGPIDASAVTGESLPAPVAPGTQMFAGSINLGTALVVSVTATGERTLLAECVRIIEAAEHGRGRFVALADRVSRAYAPVVHLTALATFLLWWQVFAAPWTTALLNATAVLIITCPCALALAVPAVQVIATSRLFRAGVLVKSPSALERLAAIDMVVFDKTGTLSHPALGLVPDLERAAADLELAAAIAAASQHPLARALVAAAPPVRPAEGVEEIPGLGLYVMTAEGEVRLGSRSFCGVVVGPPATGPELWLKRSLGRPVRFALAETLRADAADTIARLRQWGYGIHLFSGDRVEPVQAAAQTLGISDWRSGMSPVDKAFALKELTAAGGSVLMVGDGLNDGPALATASASLSPGSAAEISQNIADVVFQGDRLAPVALVLETARRARRIILENIGLSVAYNVVMVPLAIFGQVTPWLAAAAMSGSSLIVILNSLRLGKGPGR